MGILGMGLRGIGDSSEPLVNSTSAFVTPLTHPLRAWKFTN